MSDASIGVLENPSADKLVDNEAVAGHADGTVNRQRIEVCGASLLEVAEVKNAALESDAYALAVRQVPQIEAVIAEKFISQHLSLTGLPGGTHNAIGDYSDATGSGETQFYITPGAGKKMVITRLLVSISDSGSFDSGKYGNNIVLANGIKLEARDGDTVVLREFTNGHTIKINPEWAHFCFDSSLSEYGTGDEHLNVRWTFAKSGKDLLLEDDDRLTVVLNDDFSDLTGHYFTVQGYWLVGP